MPPSRSSARITDGRSAASPSSATGNPRSKATTISAGSDGRASIGAVLANASSGGATHGSSSGPHSAVLPQRFSSTEYELTIEASGMPHSSASTNAFSRGMFASRIGASTSRSGASTPNDTSNRTWSLPLPVQPCATTSAPISRATLTTSSTISGRASPDTIGYLPSYSPFALIAWTR